MEAISSISNASLMTLSSSGSSSPAIQAPVKPEVHAQKPQVQAAQVQAEHVVSEQTLKQAIQEVSQVFAGSNEAVSFTYEEKLGQLFVQITDNQSGEVIREVPSKEFIRHQVAMREMVGLILDKLA